jgi:hypothetical protein
MSRAFVLKEVSMNIRGKARLSRHTDKRGIIPVFPNMQLAFDEKPWQRNTMLYDWGAIVSKLLRNDPDGKQHFITGMYLEFDNSGTVTPFTIDRDQGTSYYANLNAADADQDYLRVPLIATSGSNSNPTNFTDDNVATFHAQTAGTTGIHGNTFSDVAGSIVYGGALVAFRNGEGDSSQDLVLARFIYPVVNQLTKLAGSQIGVTWDVTLD